MSEKWTPPGYEVTEDGRVFSVASNWRGYGRREMRQQRHLGYRLVRILLDGQRRKMRVHRLVAFAYLGLPPSPQHEVRHLDGNRANNHASNLAWGTTAENAQDRIAHGRQFYPPWDDPEFKQKMSAAMRVAHERNRQTGSGRYAR